jgi:hypothetical protein
MSYTEVRRLPVRYRHWFISRLSKEYEKKNKAMESKSHSTDNLVDNAGKLDAYEKMLSDKFK